jgi:hypothetical protein
LRIKELIGVLGSLNMTPNRAELTHCLCGEDYKSSPKIKEIKKVNSSVKFIKLDWLFACVENGNIVEAETYIL